MGLRPITLSCIALFLLVHYSYLCLYKGSLVFIYSVNTIHRLSVFNRAKAGQRRGVLTVAGAELCEGKI